MEDRKSTRLNSSHLAITPCPYTALFRSSHIEMIPPVLNNQKQTKKKVSDPFVFQSLEVILKLITIVEALDIVKIFIVESIVLKIVELRTLIPVMPWKYLKFEIGRASCRARVERS